LGDERRRSRLAEWTFFNHQGIAMKKIVLTFGLIAGAILSTMMLITLPFMGKIGFDKGEIVGYTTMVLAFLMVYFGIRSYRDSVAGGSIKFRRALLVGLLITGVAAICYVVTWEIIYYKIAPDFGDKYAAYAIEKTKKSGATDAQIALQTKEMMEFKEMYKNPLVNIAFTLLEPLPVGILFTLISAGILSRKRRITGVGVGMTGG